MQRDSSLNKKTKMEEVHEFTKSRLTEAFKAYNAEVIQRPDDFGVISADTDVAEGQAAKLIELLQKIQQSTEES